MCFAISAFSDCHCHSNYCSCLARINEHSIVAQTNLQWTYTCVISLGTCYYLDNLVKFCTILSFVVVNKQSNRISGSAGYDARMAIAKTIDLK